MKIDVNDHNKPIPKIWYRVLLVTHGIMGLSVVGTLVEGKPYWSVGCMVAGYILDWVIRFIKEDHPDAYKS